MDNQKLSIMDRIKGYFSGFRIFLKTLVLCFKQDLAEILIFTCLCTVASIVLTWSLDFLLTHMFTDLSGFSYINKGNMYDAARSPFFIMYVYLFFFASAFFSLFEIAGLLHAYSMAQVGRETNLTSMIAAGLRTCRKTLNPKNWGVILYLMVLLPIAGVLTLSSAGFKMYVPYFILQGIEADPTTNLIYRIVYALLLFMVLVYLFAINIYVLQDVTFTSALRRSRQLGKGKLLETLSTLILFTLILNFLINSIASVIPVNLTELISFFQRNLEIAERQMVVGTYVYELRQILRSIIAPAVNNAGLTVLFFRYLEEKEMLSVIDRKVFQSVQNNRKRDIIEFSVIGAIILFAICVKAYNYRFLLEPVSKPLVCAHRGDNVHAPENTFPAVELALTENMPWVEVDVIQTKDGVVVCSHDYNLKRVTGHNVVISASTFEEVERYPMGDWMPGNYDDEEIKVPTLEEILQLVKSYGADIQIELKPTSIDQNLEEEVVRLINDYEMKDHVMVISLHSHSIERIKEIDPSITTAICVNLAWEGFSDVSYTDNMSAADNAVNPMLVKQMHDKGIKVFCWTVDSMDSVQYLVSCGVDVIGTNDPLKIQEAVDLADTSGGLQRVFRILMNTFASMEYRTSD